MYPARFGLAAAAAAALAGCQSYAPKPLDLPAHRRDWLARTPSDEGVSEFARRLAQSAGGEAPEFDTRDGLSLEEGETVALYFNPDLRMARLRAEVSGASAKYAGLWEDPELGFNLERVLRSVDDPWVIGGTVGITIPVSGRLRVEKQLAGSAHRAALQRVLAQEWEVRSHLRSQWLEWSAQGLRAELARGYLDRLSRLLTIVAELERAGELSQIEARLFRIEQAMLHNSLASLEADVRRSELALRALMGLSPSAPVRLFPAPLAAGPDIEYALAVDRLESHSAALAVLRNEYEAAEQGLRLEVRRQYPDIAFGPGLGSEDGDPRLLLGVALPLPLWNRNQQALAEKTAQRELARAAFETEFERLAARVAQGIAEREAARIQRESLETGLVPLVEKQEMQAQRVAELGEVDTLLLLETLARLYETKVALIDARLAEALASVRLEDVLGPPTSGAQPAPRGAQP